MNTTYQFIQTHHTLEDIKHTFPDIAEPIASLIFNVISYLHKSGYCEEIYETLFQALDTELTLVNEATHRLIEIDDLISEESTRGFDKLTKSSDPQIHGLGIILYGLTKAIEAAKNFQKGELVWGIYGEASEAIAHGRLFMSIMTRLDDADDYEKVIDKLLSETKQHRGGMTTSRRMQEKQLEYFRLSKRLANKLWGEYSDISHNNMAKLIKEELEIKYPQQVLLKNIPSQREFSEVLKTIAPDEAPKRQASTDVPEDIYLVLVELLNKSLPDENP